ncbi:Rha family transcriptional regulator [Cysteiniphilum marinum]|uniref:Rha family transcriptional regulator n=1 Tax=Cysteiniphilum marinum TaxID=2774191 RepID=UPI00193A289C|nr:Rha family transcriptional regulator [Cysteiniphilum marinum]
MNGLITAAQTMSSREIADLANARHNDVKKTIHRLFEKDLLRASRKSLRIEETGGRPTEVYDLTYIDTMKVISGYSDEVRSTIIDRWQELETGEAQRITQDTAEPVPNLKTESYLAASKIMQATKEALKDFITDINQLALSCSQVGFKATGVDIVKLSGVQLIAHEQKQLLTVSQVGQRLKPILTGRKVNLLLAEHGYQELAQDNKERNYWLITAQGEAFGVYQDTGKRHSDGAPVRQFKWYSSIIDELQGLQEVAA